MESRVSVISIMVKDEEAAGEVNGVGVGIQDGFEFPVLRF